MNVEFKPARSPQGDCNICEVWIGGRMLATIYPTNGYGIRVISRHVDDVWLDSAGDIRTATVEFKP